MDWRKWNVVRRPWGEWAVYPPLQVAAGTFKTWREAFDFATAQASRA